MSKFKVGDRVRVRDDAVAGKSYNGWRLAASILEQDLVVKTVDWSHCRVKRPDGTTWLVGDDALCLAHSNEIHITTDGDTVHAIHKQDGKVTSRAKAVCAPGDIYDFSIGAKLAFERVLNVAPQEDKPAEPPRFDWELFRTSKQAVNCRTEHDAEVFLAWLAGRGCRWGEARPATKATHWERYESLTTYAFDFWNDGWMGYATSEFYADKGRPVIPFTREMLAEVDA